MRSKKRIIILSAVIAVLLAIIIAGNIVLSIYKETISFFLSSGTNNDFTSEEAKNALLLGDENVQEIAEESMVLLKNKGSDGKPVLPLAENNRKINMFGYGSTENGFVYAGGGSSGTILNEENGNNVLTYKRSPAEAFEEEGFEVNKDLEAKYNQYSSYETSRGRGIASIVCPPASFYSREVLVQARDFSQTAVVFISRNGSESTEVPLSQPKTGDGVKSDNTRTYLQLTTEEEEMLDIVSDNFENVIVLLNTAQRIEAGFLEDSRIDAAIYVGMPGQSGLLAVPRFLKGYKTVDGEKIAVTPSGKLSDTYAYSTREYDPTYANIFPNPSVEGDITYAENIYVGYRWYETADVEGYFDDVINEYGKGYEGVVQYPFGYGLSYTDFSWTVTEDDINIPAGSQLTADSQIEISVTVKNEGDYAGKDVVALYSAPQYYKGEIEKASVNLVAFDKTELLAPGEQQTIKLTVPAYSLASYDAYDKNNNRHCGYELDRGDYKLQLMTDAHTLKNCENNVITYNVSETINIDEDPITHEKIENRFTGSTAYMGVPIDASLWQETDKLFMTRADFEGTFPKSKAQSFSSNAVAKEANKKRNTRYDTAEMPVTEQENDLRLVTKADGTYATLDQLNGKDKVELKYNKELIIELGNNYKSEKWDLLLNQLSAAELKNFVLDGGFKTTAAESVGKPKTTDFDGPAGFHANAPESGDKGSWTAFPSESLIGCSWSAKTVYNMGRAQGTIGMATGVQGWYGPGLNLHRNPYSGRYFEYFSEDSVLTGELAAEMVRGATNLGVHCYMKHFAVSEEGINPDNVMTWLTEQMLRETYLKPFEIATKKGEANGIMTAFNCVGAVWAGACDPMNNDILRDEWGFEGALISDWASGRPYMDAELAIRGGNDFMLFGSSTNIDINNPTVRNLARTSAKNIMFMWANTYAKATDYAENGDDDRYTANIDKIVVNETVISPYFIALQVGANVLLCAGIIVCIIFIIKKPKKSI